MIFYKIVRPLILLFTKIFYPFKIFGKENVPEGRQVIVCNHFGKIDVVFVGSIFKDKIHFLAKRELFEKKFFAKIIRTLGAIPVKRDNVDLDCIREGLKILKSDGKLAIFPEGRRNLETSELQELKPGSAMFAFKTNSPILPIMMYKKAHCFRRTYLMIGKPLDFSEYKDMPFNSELNDKLSEMIRQAMLGVQKELAEKVASLKKK